MGKGISVIVGRAAGRGGQEVPVYRALRELLCSSCDSAIGEGALFTRRPVAGAGLRVAAQCSECVPFVTSDDDGAGPRRSPLTESLLAPASESTAGTSRGEAGRAAEEVAKRLGPALRYRSGKHDT